MPTTVIYQQSLTHADLNRIWLACEVLAQTLSSTGVPFSLAVCGSVAFGQAHDMSDIELFFVVDNQDIRKFVESSVFQYIFAVHYPSTVLTMVENGNIEALRIPEITFQGIILSTNIYTKSLCNRISRLDTGVVAKYRQTIKTEINYFRGFDWQYTGATIICPSYCHAYADGYISSVEIMHVSQGNSYFHIYVDKFIGAFLLWDELHIRQNQVNLYHQLVAYCRQSSHINPLGFMYKINSATSYQLQCITEQRIKHLHYDMQIANAQSTLVQVSGPTGVGKDTIISLLLTTEDTNVKIPCVTTRTPRDHEVDTYTFVSVAEFLIMIRQEQFFFWHFSGRDYTGNIKLYGIRYDDIMPLITRYSYVIFSIGGETAARFLQRRYPSSTSIWLQPESIQQLANQIRQRQGALDAEMCQRLEKLAHAQLAASPYFDFNIENKPNCISETFNHVNDALHNHDNIGQ